MPPAQSLAELAYRVNEYLSQPANMVATRRRVVSYLECSMEGPCGVIANRLPSDPANPGDFTDESVDEDKRNLPPLTVDQTAAALAALHDVHCPGVEKVMVSPDLLPRRSTVDDLRRAMGWYATVDSVLRLGEYSLHWFNLQFSRFIQGLPEQTTGVSPQSNLANISGPVAEAVSACSTTDNAFPAKPSMVLLASADLVTALGLTEKMKNAVDIALQNFLENDPSCREETMNPRKGEPRYLYRVNRIWPMLIEKLPAWRLRAARRTDEPPPK